MIPVMASVPVSGYDWTRVEPMSAVITLPCPACRKDVDVWPASNATCPHCGQAFAVHRWRTGDAETGLGSFTYVDGPGASLEPAFLYRPASAEGGEAEHRLSHAATVIGRYRADVLVGDSRVSRQHAVVERHGRRYLIRDLGSTHGTRVNGKRVEVALLRDGDAIRLGATDFRFFTSRPSLTRFRRFAVHRASSGG